MRAIFFLLLLVLTMSTSYAGTIVVKDSVHLQELFEADQDARSPDRLAAGHAPTLQQERDRRFEVFKLISEGKLQTANDFYYAGMILHHTGSIDFGDGHFASLGTESKLLAFFLFRRSHFLGHPRGRVMMAAAYNYYLQACGEDGAKFGYDFVDREPVWRPGVSKEEAEELKCGFDPRPYFEQLTERRPAM